MSKLVAAAVLFFSVTAPYFAEASLLGMPRNLRTAIERVRFDKPAMAPMAHVQFCLKYADDCRTPRLMFRGGPVQLNDDRWNDLVQVNKTANVEIKAEANTGGILTETWIIRPTRGDCNDYAVTKRHALLARGWPARALLLTEVITTWGEHHLVLIARTTAGDFILDNITGQIRIWSKTPYQFVRIQTPENPKLWATILGRSV